MRSKVLLSRMSFVLGFLIAASVFLAPVVSAREKEESVELDPRGKILWALKEKQRARFVPQSLLDRPLEELPLDKSSIDAIEHRLSLQRHPELFPKSLPTGRVAECRQRSRGGAPGSADTTFDLTTLLAAKDVVWIGTVVELEAGLDPRLVAAVEAAYVRLEELIHRKPDALAPSPERLMTVVFRGGKVNIGGTVLCDERPSGFYRPRVGDRLLLGGTVLPEEPRLFQGSIFALEGNSIQDQPYSYLKPDSGPRDLGALKARLQEVAQKKSAP